MKLSRKLRLSGVSLLLTAACAVHAQAPRDTVHLTLEESESLFLKQNLQLVAQHYNVRGDSALIQQARLWDNPTLTVDQNVYADNQGFFRHGKDADGNPTGQFYIQVQQLIQLGGKRSKAVAVASTNAAISQLQFEELMRTLRLALHKDFFTVLQLQRNANLYNAELEQITRLVSGMEAQFKAGNVSRKDYLRVQAVEVGLEQERADNLRAMEDAQAELRTLLALHADEYVQPEGDKLSSVPALPPQTIEDLVETARQHNPAYRIAAAQVDYGKLNYRYQKALAVPDLTVGPNYDRASNFAPNYFGLTLGLPLPVFNRNQGNIRAAEYNIQQQQHALSAEEIELQNNVRAAYRKLALAIGISNQKTTTFYEDYRQLFGNIVESYRSRQIGLLEFIDYLNGYEDIREKQLQQQLNIQLAKAELNYQVGTDVVR